MMSYIRDVIYNKNDYNTLIVSEKMLKEPKENEGFKLMKKTPKRFFKGISRNLSLSH